MLKVEQDFVILPGGVHLWSPDAPNLGSVPMEVVDERSKSYTLNLQDAPGWHKVSSDKIEVIGDIPRQALNQVAATGEEFIEMLTKEIGGPQQLYKYIVRVFDKREDFCRYAKNCGSSTAQSLYNPNTMEIGLHFSDATDPEDFESTYAHEFTHAFMDRIYRVREPLWFAEGMAEYFSRINWTNQGYKPTGKNWRGMMYMGEDLMPLKDVLAATRNDMYGVNFPLYYAQAWAFVRFLLKKHPELIEVLLSKGKPNLEYLSRDYMDYIKRLRRG